MPELPDRPDLGQLRRQARELQRAAAAHDEGALQKVRSVSTAITLAAAQLAVARDFGFASWPRLKAEVERRRAPVKDPERDSLEASLPPILAAWRNLPAEQQALVARQYADRPGLRPILDAVLAAAAPLGPATVEARVTVVSLVSPRRTFASVKATTKNRVDLGLRLENVPPEGRLQAARDLGSGTINVRIALAGPGEVDQEVTSWLRRAYAESVTPAPRRPARRPAAPVGSLTVVIEGTELPGRSCAPAGSGRGYRNVHVALGGRDPGRVALDPRSRGLKCAGMVCRFSGSTATSASSVPIARSCHPNHAMSDKDRRCHTTKNPAHSGIRRRGQAERAAGAGAVTAGAVTAGATGAAVAARAPRGTPTASARATTVKKAGVGIRPVSIFRSVSTGTPARAATSTMLRSPRAWRSTAPRRCPRARSSAVSIGRTMAS